MKPAEWKNAIVVVLRNAERRIPGFDLEVRNRDLEDAFEIRASTRLDSQRESVESFKARWRWAGVQVTGAEIVRVAGRGTGAFVELIRSKVDYLAAVLLPDTKRPIFRIGLRSPKRLQSRAAP